MFSLKEKIKSLAFNFWLAIQTSVCYMSNNICLYRVPTTQLIAHNILCYTVTPIYMYILILYLYDVYCWQILQAWQKEIAEAVLVCSIHSSVYKISVSLSTVDTYLCIPSESMKKLHLHYWTLIVTYKTGVIQLQPTLTPSLPLRIQNGGPSEKWITHN